MLAVDMRLYFLPTIGEFSMAIYFRAFRSIRLEHLWRHLTGSEKKADGVGSTGVGWAAGGMRRRVEQSQRQLPFGM